MDPPSGLRNRVIPSRRPSWVRTTPPAPTEQLDGWHYPKQFYLHPRKIVKAGYSRMASTYRATRTNDSRDIQLLRLLVERLPQGAFVLDAGCGSGYPVAQFLAGFFQVTGMDFSEEQIRLAKTTAPGPSFICGDITRLPFRDSTFDAVVSYYTIIHVPRAEHPELLLGFHRILRQGGLALLCMGAGDLPSDISDYHGAEMFWSHYDSETNLRMMKENGFVVLGFEIVRDPTDPASSHLFALGQAQ